MPDDDFAYDKAGHSAFHSTNYVFSQLIPYIGNKRKLLPLIVRALSATGQTGAGRTFLDLFTGSGVVSRMAKQCGYRVVASDWEPYAEAINRCYIETNIPPRFAQLGGYENAIAALNNLPPCEDWITRHLCPRDDERFDVATERMFYTRANGLRLDAMREEIQAWVTNGAINETETVCLLAPLLYTACYVSNTSGVFKGFHNGWGGQTGTALYRIRARAELSPAVFHDNGEPNTVLRGEAGDVAAQLRETGTVADVAYPAVKRDVCARPAVQPAPLRE